MSSLPGSISGLTPGAVTSTTLAFTWTAPSTGGAVSYYQVQYRVTGAGIVDAAPGTTSASLTLVRAGIEHPVRRPGGGG